MALVQRRTSLSKSPPSYRIREVNAMSKIHILQQIKAGKYRAALHFKTPGGNNSAGHSWKSAGLATRVLGRTTLAASDKETTMVDSGEVDENDDPIMIPQIDEVVNAGQISEAERFSVVAGDVVEIVVDLKIGARMIIETRLAVADKAIAEWQAGIVPKLKWYGYTQG